MTSMPKRILLLLLAAAMTLSSSGCSLLRLSTEEEAAEESRQEEARRPPETDPPETVPLNPPPPINGWEKGDDSENPDGDGPGEESGETEAPDVPVIRGPFYTSLLYEAGGKNWSYSEGKFTYTLPDRDESGIWPVEEMYNIPRDPWSDEPDQWYGGSWHYDEATGVTTQEYERAADALASVAAHHAIYLGDTSRKVVYITFTAGYENGNTAKCLDTLKEKNAPATFFLRSYSSAGWTCFFLSSIVSDVIRR